MSNIENTPLFEAYFKSFKGDTEQGGKILTLVKCLDGDKEKVRALISGTAPEEGDTFTEFNGTKEIENKISEVILSKKIPEGGTCEDVLKGHEHANAKVLFVRSEKLDEGFRWIGVPSYIAQEFEVLEEVEALEERNLIAFRGSNSKNPTYTVAVLKHTKGVDAGKTITVLLVSPPDVQVKVGDTVDGKFGKQPVVKVIETVKDGDDSTSDRLFKKHNTQRKINIRPQTGAGSKLTNESVAFEDLEEVEALEERNLVHIPGPLVGGKRNAAAVTLEHTDGVNKGRRFKAVVTTPGNIKIKVGDTVEGSIIGKFSVVKIIQDKDDAFPADIGELSHNHKARRIFQTKLPTGATSKTVNESVSFEVEDETVSEFTVSDMIFEGFIEEATDTIYERICRTVIDKLNEELEPEENSIATQLSEAIAALGRIDDDEVEALQEARALVESLEIKSLGLNEEEYNPELAAVTEIIGAARALGATFDSVGYSEGLLMVDLHNKAAVTQFADWLEDHPAVFAYDIEIDTLNQETGIQEPQSVELDKIKNDQNCTFGFSIYLDPSIVEYEGYEVDVDEDEELGPLHEVVRKIKINFKGKKRIKMKCQRGFKWDVEKRACVKIGGDEIAKMRKRLRRAVLTKRSKGAAFKTRVLRKTRKAKRFRRMMGLD